jgi:hypothetical protein
MRSLALLIVVGLVGFIASCSDTQPTQPSETPTILTVPEMAIPVEEPGLLHNEIVEAFLQEWQSDPNRDSADDFYEAFARAANQVLPRYGAPPIVEPSDMAYFVRQTLETWRQAGFDPGAPEANPVVITRLLQRRGVITTEEQQFLAQYIEAQRTASPVSPAGLPEGSLTETSETVRLFLDVATASGVLWAGDITSRRLDGAGASWGTKVVDGLGALAKLSPILRVLGAATASTMFEQYGGDVWNYFGDYPVVPPPTLP